MNASFVLNINYTKIYTLSFLGSKSAVQLSHCPHYLSISIPVLAPILETSSFQKSEDSGITKLGRVTDMEEIGRN